MDEYLSSLYYDPRKAGSFGGPAALYKAAKAEGKTISLKKIREWLKGQETYTLHRKMVHKFKRNKVQVDGIDDTWDVDLVDMIAYAKHNDGIRYVLLAIDIFSRFAWGVPLINKEATTVRKALDEIVSSGRKPRVVRSDAGKEFHNKLVKKWFDEHGILHTVTRNSTHANYVERLIRSWKARVVKYFQHRNTLRYVDRLQDFVDSYNDTFHTGIKMRPSQVNKQNEQLLWERQYVEPFVKNQNKKKKKFRYRFNVGDRVRVSYLRTLFQREYDQRWSGEVFTVTSRWNREGIAVYELKDYAGDPIRGTFYEPELQAVTFDENEDFKIEKILKTRGRGANKEYLVKWMNWPDKYNSWEKNLKTL